MGGYIKYVTDYKMNCVVNGNIMIETLNYDGFVWYDDDIALLINESKQLMLRCKSMPYPACPVGEFGGIRGMRCRTDITKYRGGDYKAVDGWDITITRLSKES